MPRVPDDPRDAVDSGLLDGHDPAALLALGLDDQRITLPPGAMLGRYRIQELLGYGGMGEVYVAEDTRLGRRVALKLFHRGALSEVSGGAQLEREARALAALNHPNVVTLYSIEEDDGMCFLTLELVEGRTLDAVLGDGLLPLPRVVEIGAALAAALAAAHAHRVLHRDLKPGNVILTPEGHVKVLDFGLAKLLRPGAGRRAGARRAPSDDGAVLGTAHYMSPEQIRGLRLDARSDLFSLGAVLYELATGRVAFAGPGPADVLEAVLHRAPPPPRSLRPEIPAALEVVILQCLRKQPSRRYRDAGEVCVALEHARSGLPRSPGLPGPVATGGRSLRARAARWLAPAGVAALALTLAVTWLRLGTGPPAPAAGVRTIAVAPFEDLSGHPEEAYVVAGITEALTTSLAQSPGLRVLTPPPGAKDLTPQQLAGRYGVTAVVAGALSRTPESVSLTVRLVSPESGELLWAASHERPLREALLLQRDAVGEIARAIRARLVGDDRASPAAAPVRPEAYEHYLKGRYYWNRRHPRTLELAVDELREAIRLDPLFAPAHAALADCYNILGSSAYAVLPPREAMPRARGAALRALELDPNLAAAHVSLGHVYLFYDWDWRRAEEAFRKAIALDERNATAHQWYSLLLTLMQRWPEGLAEAERARDLDPLSPILYVWLGNHHFYASEYSAAIGPLQEALELDPGMVHGHLFLARTHQALGHAAEAEASYRRALELSGESPTVLGAYGHFLATTGDREGARRVLGKLRAQSLDRYVPAYAFGVIHVGLGETEQAFVAVERTVEERSGAVAYLGVDPIPRPLRDTPRFRALLARLGLDAAPAGSAAAVPAPAR